MTYRLHPDWENVRPCDWEESETLLGALKEARVFQVSQAESGPGFCVMEACDDYFNLFLAPEQLYQLGTELQQLAQSAIDSAQYAEPQS